MTDQTIAGVATRAAPMDESQLVAHAYRVAHRTALGVLGSPEAADDVAQDVAVEAMRQRRRGRDPERLDAWLYRVAVRSAIRQARRERRRAEREREAREPCPDVRGDDELRATLDLLDGLPERQRAALTLRYALDLPDAAIARAMRCRETTVRSLLSRGRAALRERLEEERR